MEPILFYGVPEGCSFGSIVALEWSGRPYRLCRIGMPGEVTTEDYRRINPIGETPSLRTAAGEVISQSMAILNHIGARAVERDIGFPQESAQFDRLNEMLAYLNTSFFGAFSPLWYALEHADAAGVTLKAWGARQVQRAHADLERLLNGREWLVGDHRTIADAYFFGIARWNDFHEVLDRSEYPALARLYARLAEDPAVRFAHAIEHEEPARSAGGFRGHVSLTEALQLLDGGICRRRE